MITRPSTAKKLGCREHARLQVMLTDDKASRILLRYTSAVPVPDDPSAGKVHALKGKRQTPVF